MPLKHYGVLKGTPTNYRNSWTSNNHYQVRIDAGGDFFRIAVNVRSKLNPHDLFYAIVEDFQHPILEQIRDLPTGFSTLEKKPNKGALDYIRGNLMQIGDMKIIPESQTGKNNDLNDLFDFYVQKAIDEKALIYAFGERWFPSKPNDKYFKNTPDQGIHDIHMNQGNDAQGQFAKDNGVWQDGGLLFHFPAAGNWVAVFLRFQSQAIHTDDTTGAPITAPQPTPIEEPVPEAEIEVPGVTIMAALVNPEGPEEGNEKVMLFNPTPGPISLEGWGILNNSKRKHPLQGVISSGQTVTLTMPAGFPLSNKGGIITLVNAAGLKVHGVSYTKAQAQKEGFWLLF